MEKARETLGFCKQNLTVSLVEAQETKIPTGVWAVKAMFKDFR